MVVWIIRGKTMRFYWLPLVLVLAFATDAQADNPLRRILAQSAEEAARDYVPKPRVSVNRKQAAERVKRQYPQDRILTIALVEGRSRPVYRVKMLSDEGVVRYVYVDGMDGDVFE